LSRLRTPAVCIIPLCITSIDNLFEISYRLLDSPTPRRIIKDVMRHQLGEGEKRKKRLTSAETGSEKHDQADVLIDDGIDPADFIDPDEFGIRRKYASFDP
jgi:hypothetical protein